ncbi:Gfo/Idh/MocA family protein [Arenibacter certesii]|uniref:Oxidoreductase n=1 Tax=Arenibacter certesii TaxID=228955 RepID=A0A918MPE0_9FLAO|nr:Gfo/Idh/MocA family oxidoreductase [Arenibacter certesii]GGW42059.1 oxidoreductase [Arenibacter certesii]
MNISSRSILPETEIPIVIIGAGGIVKDAHLPAYAKAGFKVLGIYDIEKKNAELLARKFEVPQICDTIEELIELGIKNKAVFDVAVPAAEIIPILSVLPDNAAVLIQKPMGENLMEAEKILSLCRQKELVAAINFQLRYAPFVNAARTIIDSGAIGDVYDMEVKLCAFTPWHLWDFLTKTPRVEILYHSIHYIDLVRSILGDPDRVMAKTVRHPTTTVAQTKSTVIMDYGDTISATIITNHDHDFGPRHQQSYIKWEGTKGVIYARMGLLLDYPNGVSDEFEYGIKDVNGNTEWKTVDLKGSWFPDAFIGTMGSLMRFMEGSEMELPTSVEDAIKTMEAVENAYMSSNGNLR